MFIYIYMEKVNSYEINFEHPVPSQNSIPSVSVCITCVYFYITSSHSHICVAKTRRGNWGCNTDVQTNSSITFVRGQSFSPLFPYGFVNYELLGSLNTKGYGTHLQSPSFIQNNNKKYKKRKYIKMTIFENKIFFNRLMVFLTLSHIFLPQTISKFLIFCIINVTTPTEEKL